MSARLRRRLWTVFGASVAIVGSVACGARTNLFGAEPDDDSPPLSDAGLDVADSNFDSPPLLDVRVPDATPIEDGGCLFRDGFEKGTTRWTLHPRWAQSTNAAEGARALRGFWQSFDVGCPVTAAATMREDVDLTTVSGAKLR